jgi:hypothetical protein
MSLSNLLPFELFHRRTTGYVERIASFVNYHKFDSYISVVERTEAGYCFDETDRKSAGLCR